MTAKGLNWSSKTKTDKEKNSCWFHFPKKNILKRVALSWFLFWELVVFKIKLTVSTAIVGLFSCFSKTSHMQHNAHARTHSFLQYCVAGNNSCSCRLSCIKVRFVIYSSFDSILRALTASWYFLSVLCSKYFCCKPKSFFSKSTKWSPIQNPF